MLGRVNSLLSGRPSVVAAFAGMAIGLGLLSVPALLVLSPALVVAFIITLGFYPGEEAIHRVRRAVATRPEARRPARLPMPSLPLVVRPSGRLISFALAVRPPPLAG